MTIITDLQRCLLELEDTPYFGMFPGQIYQTLTVTSASSISSPIHWYLFPPLKQHFKYIFITQIQYSITQQKIEEYVHRTRIPLVPTSVNWGITPEWRKQ
jgi:hypothetical protein